MTDIMQYMFSCSMHVANTSLPLTMHTCPDSTNPEGLGSHLTIDPYIAIIVLFISLVVGPKHSGQRYYQQLLLIHHQVKF